jgi:hypothetical protein
MHSNDKRLHSEEIRLIDVIDTLELTLNEKDTLHQGRKFINHIKRPWKMKNKWSDELEKFNSAFELIKSKRLTIL